MPVKVISENQPVLSLIIEIKYGRNKPTSEQEWWLDQMAKNGWRTNVCYFWRKTVRLICEHCMVDPEKAGMHG